MAHCSRSVAQRKRTPAQQNRRRRRLATRRARRAEPRAPNGLFALLDWVETLGLLSWFRGLVTERAPQAVFHKSGCFLALIVRAAVGIGGLADLVLYLCQEQLASRLGFERELTFTNPLADLLKDFSEEMVNSLLQKVVQTLVKAGVQIGKITAIDSTFLHVFGKHYEDAARGYSGHLGKTANGYKLHLAYDVQLRLPLAIWITSGKVSDADSMEVLRHRTAAAVGEVSGHMFILDRGYFYPEQLVKIAGNDNFFVCRAKLWPKYITEPVKALQERDFTFRTAKFRIASLLVTEPTQKLLLRMVVVRHISFPKQLVLVTNHLRLRPPQVYRLYRRRFYIEALFQELRGKWKLNRFVGTQFSQVVGHIGLAVLGLTLHRCFRYCLQQRTATVGTKTMRRRVYQAPIPALQRKLTNRQLSRLAVHRLTRELVKLLQTGATRLKPVLIDLLRQSLPQPRIQLASCLKP